MWKHPQIHVVYIQIYLNRTRHISLQYIKTRTSNLFFNKIRFFFFYKFVLYFPPLSELGRETKINHELLRRWVICPLDLLCTFFSISKYLRDHLNIALHFISNVFNDLMHLHWNRNTLYSESLIHYPIRIYQPWKLFPFLFFKFNMDIKIQP